MLQFQRKFYLVAMLLPATSINSYFLQPTMDNNISSDLISQHSLQENLLGNDKPAVLNILFYFSTACIYSMNMCWFVGLFLRVFPT